MKTMTAFIIFMIAPLFSADTVANSKTCNGTAVVESEDRRSKVHPRYNYKDMYIKNRNNSRKIMVTTEISSRHQYGKEPASESRTSKVISLFAGQRILLGVNYWFKAGSGFGWDESTLYTYKIMGCEYLRKTQPSGEDR